MSGKTTLLLVMGMIAAIVLGGLLGHYAPGVMLAIGVIGKLYINILTVLVILLVVSGMVLGISNLGNIQKLTRSGGKVILYYAVTGIIAVLIGLIAVVIFNPGSGYTIPGATETVVSQSARTSYSLYSVLLEDSSLRGLAAGPFFGLVLLAILFGAGLTIAGAGARTVVTFFKGTADVIGRLARLMLFASPIGLLSLVGASVALANPNYGDIFSAAGGYTLTAVVALIAYAAVIMPIVLRIMGGKSVLAYFRNLSGALTTAFGTASSVSALPFTYEAVIDRNKVDQRAGSLVLPVGSVLNFGPTAMVVTVAALFIAQAMGVYLGFWGVLLIALVAIATSVGLAGMPGVIGPLMVLVLGIVVPDKGLAVGISIVVAADWLIDRLRSTANVCGDAVGAAVIGETFEFKTASRTTAKPGPSRRQPRVERKTRDQHEPVAQGGGPERKWERGDQRGRDRRDRQSRQGGRGGRDSRDYDRRSGQREPVVQRRDQQPSPFQVTEAGAPALEVRSGHESAPARPERPQRETPPPRPPQQPPREQQRYRPQRPERTQERPAEKPAPKPQETRVEERTSRLTRDKIEQELARVTAQLRPTETPGTQPGPRSDQPAPVKEETESLPVEPEVRTTEATPMVEEEREETMPSALADATGFEKTEPAEDEERPVESFEAEERETAYIPSESDEEVEEEEAVAPAPEEEEEPKEVTYGRSKSRHRVDRAAIEEEAEVLEETSEEPEVEDSFSNEGITFGRSKRKKTR